MRASSKQKQNALNRRKFIVSSAAAAGSAAILGRTAPLFARGSDKIRVGLIGCGGRGTGAGIIDCAESSEGVELVAIGDLFQDKLDAAPARIKANLKRRKLSVDKIYKVTPDTMFAGFDAYKKVIDSDVDLVIHTTPPGYRPAHLAYNIKRGKHAFVEKPVAVDPVGVRSVIASSELAERKGLSIVAGTQNRHSSRQIEVMKRIHDGAIGDIMAAYCFRLQTGVWEKRRRPEWSEMEWQCRNWYYYTWLSGDFIVEQTVHGIDLLNWAMGGPPETIVAQGGRQWRKGSQFGHIYDHFSVEYQYPNGARATLLNRHHLSGTPCTNRREQTIIGTKGSASPGYWIKGENPYKPPEDPIRPQVQEYADMIRGIRVGEPLNEGRRVAESSMTAIVARMSAYTGRQISWKWAMESSKLDLSPAKYEFGDAPVPEVAEAGKTLLI